VYEKVCAMSLQLFLNLFFSAFRDIVPSGMVFAPYDLMDSTISTLCNWSELYRVRKQEGFLIGTHTVSQQSDRDMCKCWLACCHPFFLCLRRKKCQVLKQ
jgi:hypothetical protein